jgi:uncharacterized coiled-coil protein SlyX
MRVRFPYMRKTFGTRISPELIVTLSERISKLEHQMSSERLTILAELKESIAHHERQLTSLRSRISTLEPNLTTDLKQSKTGLTRSNYGTASNPACFSLKNTSTSNSGPVRFSRKITQRSRVSD